MNPSKSELLRFKHKLLTFAIILCRITKCLCSCNNDTLFTGLACLFLKATIKTSTVGVCSKSHAAGIEAYIVTFAVTCVMRKFKQLEGFK